MGVNSPRGGAPTPNGGGGANIFGNFLFKKLHENEEKWTGKGDARVENCTMLHNVDLPPITASLIALPKLRTTRRSRLIVYI